MFTDNAGYRWTIACLIGVAVLAGAEQAQAQYQKEVIMMSGQPANGTAGAVFTSESLSLPRNAGVSESGKVLFTAMLEDGVGDATQDNDMGLWVHDGDSIILLAREGSPVPGKPGFYFLKDYHIFNYEDIFITPAGEIGLWACYSPTGDYIDVQNGFFVEESGTLVEKLGFYTAIPALPGISARGSEVTAFNGNRILFSTFLEGEEVYSHNDQALCIYDPGSGVTILAREYDPIPVIGGDFRIKDILNSVTLGPGGEVVVQIRAQNFPDRDKMLLVYAWDPVNGYTILRNSGVIPYGTTGTDVFVQHVRMNSSGDITFQCQTPSGEINSIYSVNRIPEETLIVNDSGLFVADGAGGATFAELAWHVLFDDGRIGLWARTSDDKLGIWVGDQDLHKVARDGDPAPGLPEGMRYFQINNMTMNRLGQVAFSDFAVDSVGNELYGLWAGDPDSLALVAVQGERIEVAPGDTFTLSSYLSTGIDVHNRTGADGFPSTFNDAGDLAIPVSFLEGGNALLLAYASKKLKVIDANEDIVVNEKFILSRVSNDVPLLTDTFVDTVESDQEGKIDISKYYRENSGVTLHACDSICLQKVLHTVPSVKHSLLLGSAYRVILDNAVIDSFSRVCYTELDLSTEQEVKVNHTTLAFSFLVSIEWDADLDYIQSLEEGFRRMSNYLYDVSDGQMRLDTVAIYDNKENWGFADIQIYASNMIWPHVDAIGGIGRQYGSASDPIEMPRKWFGSANRRQLTFTEFPLLMEESISYRTFTHEFGHFGLYLKDEYKFVDGGSLCADRIHAGAYGLMDCQYSYCGQYSSELSSEYTYASASCRNTLHWNMYQQSTWETVETLFEETYAGIPALIIRPSERTLLSGYDYLAGPNTRHTGTYLVSYDVGALVEFPITHTAPAASNIVLRFIGFGAPGSESNLSIDAVLVDTTSAGTLGNIKQGKSSRDGGMRIVGKFPGHMIATAGFYQVLAGPKAYGTGSERKWLYADTRTDFPDSIVISMNEVQGDKSLISRVQLLDEGLTYMLDAPNPFMSDPSIEHQPDEGEPTSQSFTGTAGGYSTLIPDSLTASGTFQILAVDDSGAAYCFNSDYTTLTIDSGIVVLFVGPDGVSEATLDNTDNSLERSLLLSTDYPVLRTGLDQEAIQVGPALDLALFPESSLNGDNSITIRYSDEDVEGGIGSYGLEESLHIFHWNPSAQQWELIASDVDTLHNEVTATITNAGVYAAFTTDSQTDAQDDERGDLLPYGFKLSQNYPNPFNPLTKIEYTLPRQSRVTIEIYNVLGQRIRSLVDGEQPAGTYRISWDGKNSSGESVATGVYFYRFRAGDHVETKKMLLLK